MDYLGIFNLLSKQHTLLIYERDRLFKLQAAREAMRCGDLGRTGQGFPAVPESDYDIILQAKIDALNEALQGLAKLLEL